MAFHRRYIRQRHFVLTIVENDSDDQDLEAHVKLLAEETKDLHPFYELVDATRVHNVSGFTEMGMASAAALEVERIPKKVDKLAIVVSNDAAYQLAMMYRITSAYYRSDVEVFTDFDIALAWLSCSDLREQVEQLRQLDSDDQMV